MHSQPDIMQHGNETNFQPIAIAESMWPLLAITGHDARTVIIASLPAIDTNITRNIYRNLYAIFEFPIPPPFKKLIWEL